MNLKNTLILITTLLSSFIASSQCNFTVSDNNVCGLENVTFNVINPSGNYTWDFDGDGNIDATGANVTYAFPAVNSNTVFNVSLFRNNNYCQSQAVTVQTTPDPNIGVLPGSGVLEDNLIRVCSSLPNVTLDIYNASSTYSSNVDYTIDWGDGTIENYDNSTFPGTNFISHDYSGFGYYNISITIESSNGCTNTGDYIFYNGGNPSVGLATPGNTTGLCAPATVDFPITNTANNPTGTVYNVYVSGQLITTYTQENVPPIFTYTFLQASCGLTTSTGNYENAYDVQIEATNPCGSSQATIEPIEISTPPDVIFSVNEPSYNCEGEEFTFSNENNQGGEVQSGNPSTCTSLPPSWTVTPGVPGVDWEITSGNFFGSDEISIIFYTPGEYTITMNLNSPSCGLGVYSQTLGVFGNPISSATVDLTTAASPGADECVSTLGTFINESSGDSLNYIWSVSPSNGWSFAGNSTFTSDDIMVNFTEPGDYTVSLLTSNFCDSEVWDTVLNIAAAPEITINPIGSFCETATLNFDPSSVNLDASNGTFSSVEWSFPGGSPSTFSGAYPTNIYYDSPGVYTVNVTATNQCGQASASQDFIIQALGDVELMNDQTICENGTPFLVSAVPSGGTWSGDGVNSWGLFTPSQNIIGDNILTYTYQDNNCQMQGTMVVTVLGLSPIDAGPDQEACVDDAVFLISEGTPNNGTWTVDNGGVIIGNNTFDPVASGAGVYTLTYTITDSNNCNNTDTKTIIVHDLPAVDAGLDQSICDNPFDITLTGLSPAGGTWTGTGVTSNGIFNAANTPGLGDYTLTYTYTNPSTNCTNSDTKVISIVPNDVADAGMDEEVCINEPSFSIQTGTPLGGTWSGNGITNGTNIFDPIIAGEGTHVVTYTFGVGICETSDTKVITVIGLPEITLPNFGEVCINNGIVDLNGATPAGGTWSGNSISGSQFDPSTAGVGVHTLTYSYIDMNTLCSNSESTQIEVFGLPVLSANDTSYCNTSGFVDLPQGNPVGGTWSGDGVSGNQFDPSIAGGIGNYILTYTYSDGNNCENSTTISASVISTNNINAGNDFEICIDADVIDLSQMATPAGGTWNSNGSAGLNGNNFNPFTAGQGIHILTYTIGSGNCQVTDEVQITIHALPTVETMPDFEVCASESSVVLSATPSGGTWNSNNGGVIGANIFNATASSEGSYSFTYIYTDNNGCSSSDDLIITVNPLPIVSSNDTFYCNTPGFVDLPQGNPVGGIWSGNGVSGNQFDPSIAGGVGIHILTYTYSDGNNCENSTTISANVTSANNINAGDDFEVCIDAATIDLSQISSPAGGTWNSNGSGGLNGNNFNPFSAGTGTHTLTYTIGTGNCQVNDEIQITVHALPTVEAMPDFEVCASENAVLLNATPAGGTWISNNGGIIGTNIFNATASGEGSYSFTYTYSDVNGCISSDDLVITVNPLPIINTNDTSYCNTPGLVPLPFATPINGTWSGQGVSNNLFNPQIADSNPNGVGEFDLVYTYIEPVTGCVNSDTIVVSVFAPQTIIAGANDTICIDQGPYQLSGFSPANGTWSGTGITDAAMGIFDPIIAGEGLHTLTYAFGIGNCYVDNFKTVLVIDLTDVEAGPDQTTCLTYDEIELTGSSPAGGVWSGIGISDPINGMFNPAIAQVGDHILTYTYTDSVSGCFYSDEKIMTVFPMENPTFNMPNLACRNELVSFENLSPANYSASWNFGDGNTSTDFSPQYAYDVVGTYEVSLTVENEHGCVGEIVDTIVITDVPVAYFQPDTSEACVGLELNLNNLSVGEEMTYHWNFGDNQISTDEHPDIIYLEDGINDTTYIITLTTTNLCGSSTFQDVITVHPLPSANIGISPQTDCSPLLVDFANISTGAATDFQWDFGNGSTSEELVPPTQTFVAHGNIEVYTVSLISSNICGSDTATTQITVEPPNVDALAGASQLSGCLPLTVDFYNYSTPGAAIDWEFGDGNSSSETTPTHTFDEVGEYTVIQYASSDCGYDTTTLEITVYPSPEVSFSHPTYVCKNQPMVFQNSSINTSGHIWDFGDGGTSQLNAPEHIFTEAGEYTVTLTGISIYNQCPASYSTTVTVVDIPAVSFDPSALNGCVPFEIELTNTSETPIFYQWDFGDGNTSIEASPNHTFEAIGTYAVTLVATDINGCFNDTTISNIIVHPRAEAAFDFEREALCGLPAVINFENNSVGATGYTWDFGNGAITNNNNPAFPYSEAGEYSVELVATNQFSCADTMLQNLTIYPEPEANFEIDGAEGCEPMEVTFRNTSTESNNFYWDFGNGMTSTENNPAALYEENGLYDISLIVSVDDACFDTLVLQEAVNVHITPFANFQVSPGNQGVDDGTFQMINLSENADNYYWEFSDGYTTEAIEPTHRFFNNGNKQILLEASTKFGCVDDTLINFIPETIKGLHLPNAFSPEQGLGDVRLFKPAGVGIKEYHIQIFSPYGQLLWESKELEDGQPAEAWDGTINGKLVAQDVYVWKAYALFDDGTIWQGVPKKNGGYKTMGSVTLLR